MTTETMTTDPPIESATAEPQAATVPTPEPQVATMPVPSGDAIAEPVSAPTFVYAIGRIEPRFPTLGVEKEFAQATGRADTAGLTDRQATHAVLSDPANRYLVRKLCWVLTIEGQDSYILVAREGADLDMLINAVAPTENASDIDVVIGTLGPLSDPDTCNGLIAPLLGFDQVYSFDADEFLSAIPRPDGMGAAEFRAAAAELFDRVSKIADNAGATDEHRALNYLSVRYPAIYARATEQFGAGTTLTSVEVLPSRLSGVRTLVNVVFTYTHRTTGVAEKYAARVDVTELFPFLAAPLAPYYDR